MKLRIVALLAAAAVLPVIGMGPQEALMPETLITVANYSSYPEIKLELDLKNSDLKEDYVVWAKKGEGQAQRVSVMNLQWPLRVKAFDLNDRSILEKGKTEEVFNTSDSSSDPGVNELLTLIVIDSNEQGKVKITTTGR